MGLFNKKKIRFLERSVSHLWEAITRTDKEIHALQNRPLCPKVEDFIPDESVLRKVVGHLGAIEEHLGIAVRSEYSEVANTEQYTPSKVRVKVYKAHKI